MQGLRKRLEHRVFERIKNGIVSPHHSREVSDQYGRHLNQSAFLIQKTWGGYRKSKDLAAEGYQRVASDSEIPPDIDSHIMLRLPTQGARRGS